MPSKRKKKCAHVNLRFEGELLVPVKDVIVQVWMYICNKCYKAFDFLKSKVN